MAQASAASPGKVPRTARGRETLRRLLDAAAAEFGERGFHEASVSGITRRAGTALGSFYTYFDSKDAIFTALVRDMSARVATTAAAAVSEGATGLRREREALVGFLHFAREHKEIYRIIDEAEFVAPEDWRAHYLNTARRIEERLLAAHARGELATQPTEVHAWAIMGMNVFLGLRFGVMAGAADLADVAAQANALLKGGLGQGGFGR